MAWIGAVGGFEFHVPTSGGKAGYGCNKTSTVQVRKGGYLLKQFRFEMASRDSRLAAMRKARAYAKDAQKAGR